MNRSSLSLFHSLIFSHIATEQLNSLVLFEDYFTVRRLLFSTDFLLAVREGTLMERLCIREGMCGSSDI